MSNNVFFNNNKNVIQEESDIDYVEKTDAKKGGGGVRKSLEPPFLAAIICEQPLIGRAISYRLSVLNQLYEKFGKKNGITKNHAIQFFGT